MTIIGFISLELGYQQNALITDVLIKAPKKEPPRRNDSVTYTCLGSLRGIALDVKAKDVFDSCCEGGMPVRRRAG